MLYKLISTVTGLVAAVSLEQCPRDCKDAAGVCQFAPCALVGTPGGFGTLETTGAGCACNEYSQCNEEDDIIENQQICAQYGSKNHRCNSQCESGTLVHNTHLCGQFVSCVQGRDFGCTEQEECGKATQCTQTCILRTEGEPTSGGLGCL